MGIFDWLGSSAPVFLYQSGDDKRRMTPNEYGRLAVNWAFGVAGMQVQLLALYGSARDTPDILTKIAKSLEMAELHSAAFLAGVYCSYPVVRLEISNKIYSGVMQGVVDQIGTIDDTGLLGKTSKTYCVTPEYLEHLRHELGQYSAALIDAAGRAPLGKDKMQIGVLIAYQRLIQALSHEYSLTPSQSLEKPKDSGNASKTPSVGNLMIETTRGVFAETLIENSLLKQATDFVQSCDRDKSLTLI